MTLSTPDDANRFFQPRMARDVEEFWVATLDAAKRVTASRCLFRGTVDHCLFHPRDLIRFVCVQNASSFVVAHNHPSGERWPSPQDVTTTEHILSLAILIEVPLVDHLILARQTYFSFLAAGRLRSSLTGLPSPSAQ